MVNYRKRQQTEDFAKSTFVGNKMERVKGLQAGAGAERKLC